MIDVQYYIDLFTVELFGQCKRQKNDILQIVGQQIEDFNLINQEIFSEKF